MSRAEKNATAEDAAEEPPEEPVDTLLGNRLGRPAESEDVQNVALAVMNAGRSAVAGVQQDDLHDRKVSREGIIN